MFKYTTDQVKEIYAKRGCKFLDSEFLGVMHKHNYLCVCGNTSSMTLNNFFKGKNCKKCGFKKQQYTFEEVKSLFEKYGCVLVSENYSGYRDQLEFFCTCGKLSSRSLEQFQRSKKCEDCCHNNKAYTLSDFISMYSSKGFKLLDAEIYGVHHSHNCICACGRPTKKSWNSLRRGKGCRACQFDTYRFSYNKAKYVYADAGWELLDNFYKNNNYLHNAKCKCGYITKKRLNDLKKHNGCRKCGNNYIPTVEELKKEYLEQGCEFLDDFYVNSHYLHNYKCKCGKMAKMNLNNWRNGRRCKDCGNIIVFDNNLPSNVYLLERYGLFKIGVNNRKSWRLVIHKNAGWEVIDKMGPILGSYAKEIEKTVKDCLKSKNISTGQDAGLSKFDGYTECWRKDDFCVSSLRELWEKL
jgi:hypothetical protein